MPKPHLLIALGDHPHSGLLRAAVLTGGHTAFRFADVRPIPKAFAPMVQRQAYDMSEIAIVTALQAAAYDRPVILLPLVLSSRFQRKCLIGYRPRGLIDPRELGGRTVGVRAFTQTTGMWVRAALYEDYGLEPTAMRWRTQEPAHVQEYIEPAFVEHDTTNKSLPDQLRDGDLPAAVMGMDLPDDPTFAPLIPDPEAADRASYVRLGFMPINHMVAVSVRAAKRAPEAIRLAYRLLAKGIEESDLPQGAPRSAVADYDAVEASTAYAIEEAYRQHLIPARISVKDLFQHSRRLLNI